jgi:IMP dehydrogenase/GMP reductase
MCGGLRSGCTYAGAINIRELQENAVFREVSNNYMKESNFRH